jgi:hypothetical protein
LKLWNRIAALSPGNEPWASEAPLSKSERTAVCSLHRNSLLLDSISGVSSCR